MLMQLIFRNSENGNYFLYSRHQQHYKLKTSQLSLTPKENLGH